MREMLTPPRGMKSRALVAGLLVLTVFALLGVQPAYAASTDDSSDSTEPTITVTITYATYTDLDHDSFSDDVLVITRFDIEGLFPYCRFAYLITLQLPSGTNYSYIVYVLAFYDTVTIENLFFNHATESGDYTVYVHAILYTPGTPYDYKHYVFDPPGGSEGGKPTFGVR